VLSCRRRPGDQWSRLSQTALIEGGFGVDARGLATIRNSGTVIFDGVRFYGAYLGLRWPAGEWLGHQFSRPHRGLQRRWARARLHVDNFGTISGVGDGGSYGLDVEASGSARW